MSSKNKAQEAIKYNRMLKALAALNEIEREISIRDEARQTIMGSIVKLSGRTLNRRERRAFRALNQAQRTLKVN